MVDQWPGERDKGEVLGIIKHRHGVGLSVSGDYMVEGVVDLALSSSMDEGRRMGGTLCSGESMCVRRD